MAEEKKVGAKAAPKPAAEKTAKPAPRKRAAAKENVEVEVVKKVGAKVSADVAAPKAEAVANVVAAPKKPAAPKAPKVVKADPKNRTYATGKRKTSIARVWIMPGRGVITVNNKESSAYFRRPVLQLLIGQPFDVAGRKGAYDVWATIKGGGLSGQAGALKHGISRAIALAEPELRGLVKEAGFLTRDSRIVERKHFGHKKARRSFQFSKR